MNEEIARNLAQVRAHIVQAALRYGRDPAEIRLLAVSKTKPLEMIRAALDCGQSAFGENYVQESLPKISALPDAEWHFIGALQANKTRPVAENFAWLHSLDSLKLAQRLDRQRPAELPPLQVCLQVNISREAQKAGVLPEHLRVLAEAVVKLPRLRLRGLMAVPAEQDEFALQRQAFRELFLLYRDLRAEFALDTLSMGMSHDLEAAIAEGTTLLRIGTAIFGARDAPARA
jgi:pyridoxal phosphate enzyme (YggS family)